MPVAYFFDDTLAARVDADLAVHARAGTLGSTSFTCRVEDLSPEGTSAVAAILEITSQAVARVVEVVSDLDRGSAVIERGA